MLIVIVHGIDLRNGILERLEVAIEYGLLARSLLVDQVLDAVVGLVSPPTDADLHPADARRPGFQFPHIVHIMGLGSPEDVLAITADGLAIGGQRAIGLDIDIEEDDVGEPRILEFLDGGRPLAPDVATHIDARPCLCHRLDGSKAKNDEEQQ